MKWFKHESTARHDVKIKILMQKHGTEGYGVYFLLLELIAEYAVDKNINEWGFVDKFHTVDTLANECGVSPDKLREILATCNELDLFQKNESRLYCRQILKRLDDYAQRVLRKSEARNPKKEDSTDNVRTQSEQSSVRVEKIRVDKSREEKSRLYFDKSAKAPQFNKDNPLKEVLENKAYALSQEIDAKHGIHTEWQDKAFRYADKLGITLGSKVKGRWLKIFKQASEGRKAANLESAYRYIADYPKPMSNEQKMLFFFKIYENGMDWLQNGK